MEVEDSGYDSDTKKIERHRTALTRTNFSAPIQALIRFGYLDGNFSVFDYGCGRGDDLHVLRENKKTHKEKSGRQTGVRCKQGGRVGSLGHCSPSVTFCIFPFCNSRLKRL